MSAKIKPSEIVKKIKELEGAPFISIEEVYPITLFDKLYVSGVGIVITQPPPRIRVKLYSKRFTKAGRIVRFNDAPVSLLVEFRDYVLFLVTKATLSGEEINVDPLMRVFVVEYDFVRRPHRLKQRFRPWKFYTGEIKYSKKMWRVKWMAQVPTYDAQHVMFLGSREDEYNLKNIALKYTHLKYENRILAKGEYPATILFS